MTANIIIFDLFGTILKDISNDYIKGLEYLASDVICDATIEDIKLVAEEYRSKHMSNRVLANKEASMLLQLELFKERLSFNSTDSLSEIEYKFLEETRLNEINDGLIVLLDFLKQRNYRVFVMSNTIFSANSLKKYLEKYGIATYFEEIFASSDFGYRKPSKRFFASVFRKISKTQKVNKSEIIFIGDKLEKDALGARAFGYTPIWLTKQNDGFGEFLADCVRVANLKECKDYIESNYIYVSRIQNHFSTNEGPGNRLVVYLQGCERNCEECHNQYTWDINKGKRYRVKDLVIEILSKLSKYVKNVTISGGEPLYQGKALATLTLLLSKAKLNVCLYTGYEFDEVPPNIKNEIQFLKTGSFAKSLKITTKGYFGSTNQKMWIKEENGIWKTLKLE